jgi:hypothetical protein
LRHSDATRSRDVCCDEIECPDEVLPRFLRNLRRNPSRVDRRAASDMIGSSASSKTFHSDFLREKYQ